MNCKDAEDIDLVTGSPVHEVTDISEQQIKQPETVDDSSIMHLDRFKQLGRFEDLEKAVQYLENAAATIRYDDPDKASLLSNLANTYQLRFHHLGQLADIEAAITHQTHSVFLTSDKQLDMPARLDTLASLHYSRLERLGDPIDADTAISCLKRAVSLMNDEHPDKPSRFRSLGDLYNTRFALLGQDPDLETAIMHQSQAVSLTPEGHPDMPTRRTSLGNSYFERFNSLGQLPDLETAITSLTQALEPIPDGHPFRFDILTTLAMCHQARFGLLHKADDISASMTLLRDAAQSKTGDPISRIRVSRMWAVLSFSQDPLSSLDAYKLAMELIPQVAWLGGSLDQRYHQMLAMGGEDQKFSIARIVSEAVDVALYLEHHELTLEWLEEGRSIVWKQQLQLRSPLDELYAADAALGQQLAHVAQQLDCPASSRSTHIINPPGGRTLESTAQEHWRLVEQWEKLVDRARALPGLHSFLRPKTTLELMTNAAQSGPVVVINVGESSANVLIVYPGSDICIDHVNLRSFSIKEAAYAHSQFSSAIGNTSRSRGFTTRPVKPESIPPNVLCLLWKDVVMPVLIALDYLDVFPPPDELPHITWCTTGLLSLLPLHAAGDYSKPNCALYHHAVSSYTPTLNALYAPRPAPNTFSGILAVGQASTSGLSALPNTTLELDCIEEQAANFRVTRLDGEKATPSTVINQMEQHSWVHLACHASQNSTNPTKSAFHLHNGALDLAAITQRPLKNAQLAFLSACQTATGDRELPEESIHLAAGMLMAGFPTVIATLWPIQDVDAPVITKVFYEYVLKDGVPDARKSARALHAAVGHLRERVGIKEFTRWAAYIHIGK